SGTRAPATCASWKDTRTRYGASHRLHQRRRRRPGRQDGGGRRQQGKHRPLERREGVKMLRGFGVYYLLPTNHHFSRGVLMSEPGMAAVKGLRYLADFITPEQQDALVRQIDAQPWLGDLRRRVQHYGYKYDYKARAVDVSMRLGPLPEWALEIVRLAQS